MKKKYLIPFLALCLAISACAKKSGDDNSDSSSNDSTISGSDESGGVISIGNDDDSDPDSNPDSNRNLLRITTFNAGLLPAFVQQSDERAALIADRLASDTSDIICVQELWRASDRSLVEQRLAAQFPYRMHAPARQKFAGQSPVCTIDSFQPIAECLLSQCSFSQGDLLACAIANCQDTLFTLAEQEPLCAAALFAQSGRSANEVLEIQEELLSDSANAGLFAFGGESGTELFSRVPLRNQRVIDFFDDSTTSRRVALLADVEQNGVTVQIGCTHLASNLDGLLPYTGPHGSWEGENLIQARRLVSESATSIGFALAGDFNCSELNNATGANADFPTSCQEIRAAGFADPAGESLRCTYCNENILNQLKTNQGEQRDLVLDHIFIRALPILGSAEIFYTDTILVDGSESNLSDHYGASLLVRTQP